MQANAVSLSAELPQIEGGTQKVLYPSSAKASSDLQVGICAHELHPELQIWDDQLELSGNVVDPCLLQRFPHITVTSNLVGCCNDQAAHLLHRQD